MATIDTQNQPIRRRDEHDTRMVWTLVALVVFAILAYAAYTSYYVPPAPIDYGTRASNNTPTTAAPPTTTE